MSQRIMEKIKTLIWFLKRPALYSQLLYQFAQKFFPHPDEKTRPAAQNWCLQHAVSTFDALSELTGEKNFDRAADLHKMEFAKAEEIVGKTPVQMGGGGDCDLLYHLTLYKKPVLVLETGVAYGWSSLSILLGLHKNGAGSLVSTDMPYVKMNNEDYVGCVVPEHLKPNWELIRKPDRNVLKKLSKELDTVDLVHYDSDKSYRGRMWAYPILWEMLNTNGLLISDDINDNLAFQHFAYKTGKKALVIQYLDKFIGILVKN